VLLVKDETAQSLLQVLSLRADPEVNIQVDWGKVIKQLFQARHLDVLKSDEEIDAARAEAAKQPPPVAPAVQVAQIREEGALKREQMESKQVNERIAAEAELDLQRQRFEADEAAKDRALEQMMAEMDERIAMAEVGSSEKIALEKEKVLLTSWTLRLRQQADMAVADHAVNINQSNQTMAPPTEPAGRAQAGKSFIQ
jgi:hypothetical protein